MHLWVALSLGCSDSGGTDAGQGSDAGSTDSGPTDPCAGNGGCDVNATCTAIGGGYRTCHCLPGFAGDGFVCNDVAGALSGLRWEIPCGPSAGNHVCSGAVLTETSTVLKGAAGVTYDITLRLRGVVELKSYSGGQTSTTTPYFVAGASAGADGFNIYRLGVADPPESYFLNAGTSGIYNCFPIDYEVTIPMAGGTTVTLSGDPTDGREIENVSADGTPIVIPGVPPAPAAYNGQFIQMDVVRVAPH